MHRTAFLRHKGLWVGLLACFASAGMYFVFHRAPSTVQAITPLPVEEALFQSLDKDLSRLVVSPTNPVRMKRSDEDDSFTISFARRGDLIDEVEEVVLRYDATQGSLLRRSGKKADDQAPVCTGSFSRIDLTWDSHDETMLKLSVCSRNRDAAGKKPGPTFSWKIQSSF